MYNYAYFLLYVHQSQYLQKVNVYIQNDLAFSPHPTPYSTIIQLLISFLVCLGEDGSFRQGTYVF